MSWSWFVVVLLLTCGGYATLQCLSADDAVTAIRAACAMDKGCVFFFPDRGADFAQLVQHLHLVQNGTAAQTDIRTVLLNVSPASLTTLVAFGTDDYGDNCTALSSVTPPPEIQQVVHALMEYQFFLAQERVCDSESEVATIDGTGGPAYCMATDAHVCISSTGIDDTLATGNFYLAFVVLAGMLIAMIVLTVQFGRKWLVRSDNDDTVPLRSVSK